MSTMNISLPDSQAEYVKGCVESEGYQTISEYFRYLVREDQKRKAEAVINTLILEGLNSPTSPLTDEDWASIRSKLENSRKGRLLNADLKNK
jgi:antitoxin ParD1/3/4